MPSNNLEAAGVLLHQFDGNEIRDEPWLPCSKDSCADHNDRWSSTIVNANARKLYSSGHSGWVLSPSLQADGGILCSYAGDGGTQGLRCNPRVRGGSREAGCVPGCFVPGHTRRCTFEEPNGCAWAPEDLRTMLETHAARKDAVNRYNEVVVDTKVVVDGLPHTIEAAFFMVEGGTEVAGSAGYAQRARDAVALFRTRFKREPHELPLLSLDLTEVG